MPSTHCYPARAHLESRPLSGPLAISPQQVCFSKAPQKIPQEGTELKVTIRAPGIKQLFKKKKNLGSAQRAARTPPNTTIANILRSRNSTHFLPGLTRVTVPSRSECGPGPPRQCGARQGFATGKWPGAELAPPEAGQALGLPAGSSMPNAPLGPWACRMEVGLLPFFPGP